MTSAVSDRNEVGNQPTTATIINGAYTISWTATSDDASLEAEHAHSLGQYLVGAVRARESLHVHLERAGEDCPTYTGDAVLCLRLRQHDGGTIVHDVLLQGNPQPHVVMLNLPWDEAQTRIVRLLKAYLVERCQRDTFASWVRDLPTSVVRTRLGLANVASETTGGVPHTASSYV